MPYDWHAPAGPEDPLHRRMRCPEDEFHEAMRRSFERIFEMFEPLAGEHWRKEFPLDGKTLARFWEAYVGASLVGARLRVCPERDGLPDFQVVLKNGAVVWVECVSATLGDPNAGQGAVPRSPRSLQGQVVAADYPDAAIRARVAQAIDSKFDKSKSWRQRGVSTTDQVVIAVNDAALVNEWGHGPLRSVVRVAFGLTHQVVEINPRTGTSRYAGWDASRSLKKAHHAPIDVGWFQKPDHNGTSALVYGSVGPHANSLLDLSCLHAPLTIGAPGYDLELLHNPFAASPIMPGWFPVQREWSVVESDIVSKPGRLAGQ